tara:strand:+ start:1004 stop:1228 length:225 start_codon:yes stop_codon:yes gene_type:complete
MKKRYCIILIDDINIINFQEVIENRDTLRYNIADTKFIIKYTGEKPSDLSSYTDYSHSEILDIINNPAKGWIKD